MFMSGCLELVYCKDGYWDYIIYRTCTVKCGELKNYDVQKDFGLATQLDKVVNKVLGMVSKT